MPKLPTWAGVRRQATAATIAAALWKNLTASRAHGRRAALSLLFWINDCGVLERRGWVRADPAADRPADKHTHRGSHSRMAPESASSPTSTTTRAGASPDPTHPTLIAPTLARMRGPRQTDTLLTMPTRPQNCTKTLADRLLAAISAGHASWQKPWVPARTHAPGQPPATGYQGNNPSC
ncbi:MAG: hypothetical protein OXG42_06735 [Chloroflexi bacterium]|nr:hypothetical protein [Chloroflexota bacterium]